MNNVNNSISSGSLSGAATRSTNLLFVDCTLLADLQAAYRRLYLALHRLSSFLYKIRNFTVELADFTQKRFYRPIYFCADF